MDHWRDLYSIIYQANMIIEGVNKSQALSAGLKKQLTGSLIYAWAFIHFYLMTFFGEVPLITKSDVAGNLLSQNSPNRCTSRW